VFVVPYAASKLPAVDAGQRHGSAVFSTDDPANQSLNAVG
jgi:hypothetical protein